jgi:hypothetical protein
MTLTIIILVLLFLLIGYVRRIIERGAGLAPDKIIEVVSGTKVLVCSLGEGTAGGFEDADAKVYSTYYRHVDVAVGQGVDDFLRSVAGNGYDVIHLFCELDEDGEVVGGQGARLNADTLFEVCKEADVKVLFIAGDNPREHCDVFVRRKRYTGVMLNVVMTVSRLGDRFPFFLEGLLRGMSAGKTMPYAWVDVAPQAASLRPKKAPGVYTAIEREGIVLLP